MENHYNCIYLYKNKVNGKKYVGQAKDFNKRHKSHIKQSYNEKQKYDYNVPFHNAIRKHGIENFEIEILKENLQNQEELNYWECYYIQEFDTLANNNKGYNLASGGSNGNTLAGKTDEEKAEISKKISETMKEAWENRTDEELAEFSRKISEEWENRTDEEKANIKCKLSKANKGKNNPRARKIVSVDLDKNLIKIWNYKKEPVKELGISLNTLNKTLHDKRKTREYAGCLWYYLNEYEQLNK